MDLLSPRPFWPVRDGLPAAFPPSRESVRCDVAIIGAGVSGAMTALLLTEAGLDVVVLDRREAAHGSTAGNTGLMLYELDTPLHVLAKQLGQEQAERAFLRCRAAVDTLERVARRSRIECGFERKSSLYLAATPTHVARLQRELEARQSAGLDGEWWSRARLARESSLPHRAAILSPDAAQLDVYRMTYGLLLAAQRDGALVHDRTEVTGWKFRRDGVELATARGPHVRATHLVVASGYESEKFLPRRYGDLHSTFAFASEPVDDGAFHGWPSDGCLIWDTGDPYLYLRTTSDNRIIMGGYDVPFYGPQARDRLLRSKTIALARRFRELFPRIELEMATAWAGTFGVSDDGLPYIGRHTAVPHTWFALGFGGNGTTFSLIAAEMIRNGILGRPDRDAALFGFERAENSESA